MRADIQIYCECIGEVRTRLDVVQSLIDGGITTAVGRFNVETIFLQFRKTLELIAFASLTANRAAYSTVHRKFSDHWKAKAMLDALKQVNPDFYPVALDPPQETAPGIKHFSRPSDGFMTIAEFASLYDAASELIHTRNPFSTRSPVIEIVYPAQEWVSRIRRLLAWHLMHLVGGDKWIVNVPVAGDVQAWPASPKD